MKAHEQIKIVEFLQKTLSDDITDQEFSELNNMLQNSREARQFYQEILQVHMKLEQHCKVLSSLRETVDEVLDTRIWSALAENEKTAPSVEIPKEEPQVIRKVESVEPVRKVNKFSLYTAVVSMAALLFLVVFIRFIPVEKSQQIAVLSNSMNAQWSYPRINFEIGDPIYNESMELSKGFVEFTYENGVKLIVEGPARFTFEDGMQTFLEQGKLTAKVTPAAKGFTIRTRTATVVDYGTEFGVISDSKRTEAHVFSGNVDLRLGSDVRYYEKSMRLKTGQAAVSNLSSIQKIELRSEDFFTDVPSQYELCIRKLNPSFYSYAGDKGPIISASSLNVRPVVDDSVRCVPSSPQDHQPHDYAWDIDGSQGGILFSNTQIPVKGSYTIAFWVKLEAATAFQTIFTERNSTYGNRHICIDETGRFLQTYITEEGKKKILPSVELKVHGAQAIKAGQWTHVALIFDFRPGNNLKTLMANGTVVDNKISVTEPNVYYVSDLYLGGCFPGQSRVYEKNTDFAGQISDVLFLNRAIRPEDVKQLYKASLQKKSN